MKLNMFRATHRPSSGAKNCTSSLWFAYVEGCWTYGCWALSGSAWQRPATIRPTTFHVCKPEAASAVCGSWWWTVCRPKHVELHINIIITIIIWHYNPSWVFAFSAKSLQVLLSLAASFQFLTFSFFVSSMTSSCHCYLGLPTGLVPIGFQSRSFLVGLAWSILWICPHPFDSLCLNESHYICTFY